MNDVLLQIAIIVPALVLAIVSHEVAHGLVARALGDPTAAEARRLTFNPLRHVDPVGTLILPGMLALAHAPVFGWAKPVPVNPRRLDNPRYGMMVVAAAGPLTNLVLALLGAVALGLLVRVFGDSQAPAAAYAAQVASAFVLFNVFLALFNLLPIPPFDGSHILEGLLPRRAARAYARLRPYGIVLMFLFLLVIPYLFPHAGVVERVVQPPVNWALDRLDGLVRAVGGIS